MIKLAALVVYTHRTSRSTGPPLEPAALSSQGVPKNGTEGARMEKLKLETTIAGFSLLFYDGVYDRAPFLTAAL